MLFIRFLHTGFSSHTLCIWHYSIIFHTEYPVIGHPIKHEHHCLSNVVSENFCHSWITKTRISATIPLLFHPLPMLLLLLLLQSAVVSVSSSESSHSADDSRCRADRCRGITVTTAHAVDRQRKQPIPQTGAALAMSRRSLGVHSAIPCRPQRIGRGPAGRRRRAIACSLRLTLTRRQRIEKGGSTTDLARPCTVADLSLYPLRDGQISIESNRTNGRATVVVHCDAEVRRTPRRLIGRPF